MLVHNTAKARLRDLNVNITEERHDSLTSEVRGTLSDGTKVWQMLNLHVKSRCSKVDDFDYPESTSLR